MTVPTEEIAPKFKVAQAAGENVTITLEITFANIALMLTLPTVLLET